MEFSTNTVQTSAYRGAGRPEATYALERTIDIAARELGLDPFDLRLRNLIPPEAMPFRTGLVFTYDFGEFAGNMEMAAELIDRAGFPARREEARTRGRLRGLGYSNPIEVAGGPFGRPGKDMSRITADPSGLTLECGIMSAGQGLETAMTQLAGVRLGIDPSLIRYRQGDTDRLAFGRGSGGSSSLAVGGAAVALAVDGLIEKARALAAHALETSADDLEFAAGAFRVVGTDRVVTLAELALTTELAFRRGRVSARRRHLSERLPRLRGRDRSGDGEGRDHRLCGGRRMLAACSIRSSSRARCTAE